MNPMQTRWLWASFVTFAMICAVSAESYAIQITDPEKASTVRPGDTMKVKIRIPAGLPVSRVTDAFLEEERALEDKVERPLAVSSVVGPFDAEMLVPLEAAGPHRLLAVAQVRERRGFYV